MTAFDDTAMTPAWAGTISSGIDHKFRVFDAGESASKAGPQVI
jgi:hypothetical protein